MTTILNAEQIAELCQDLDGLSNIRAINKLYREQDESHLWPISGKFNAVNRAIRKARQFQVDSGAIYGLEYCYLLDNILSEIVNNELNW